MKPLGKDEIVKMKLSCELAAKTLQYASTFVKVGTTTNEIDQLVEDFTKSNGARSAPLNYHGFPKSICTSVNECICHGVPDNRALKEGDIINLDITCELDGFYGDTSATFFVGEVSAAAKAITEHAKRAMEKGIEVIKPFGTTGDIGFAINKYVTKQGYYAVREIGGHGIGQSFHGEPFVPSFGKKGRGDRLEPWTCITVEPMINENDLPIREMAIENSSIKYYETQDKSLTAQFEHTILITDTGYEVLTVY
ncbi:MAG: type I methionyl aminopeptidase [Bdellovibrionaceae bacterium]|nr:type I methionyl aminopeptidase [Pseudobdellovibrionaceae bacterium]